MQVVIIIKMTMIRPRVKLLGICSIIVLLLFDIWADIVLLFLLPTEMLHTEAIKNVCAHGLNGPHVVD